MSLEVIFMSRKKSCSGFKKIPEPPMEKEATEPKLKNGIVCGSKFVRVRSDPSLNSEVLEVLEEGMPISILSMTRDCEFYRILLPDGTIGYMKSEFVKEE